MKTNSTHVKFYGNLWLLIACLWGLFPLAWAADLPNLGTGLATTATGLPTNTQAKFSGGISVNGVYQTTVNLADTVDVTGDIIVDPADVGEKAVLFVHAVATFPNIPGESKYMLDQDEAGTLMILAWDGNNANLAKFIPKVKEKDTLTEKPMYNDMLSLEKDTPRIEVHMYNGTLYLAGTLKVYFGYRLKNGKTVYNPTPIDITIEPIGPPRYYSTPTPEQTYFLGSEIVGKTVFQNLLIAENGNADLQVNFHSLDGAHAEAFTVTPANFAFTIADGGGATEVVQIQCTPTFVGEHTARLTIQTNDPTQPMVGYTLQCNGVPIPPPPEPKYVSIPAPNGTLKFNESASLQQITVSEGGNATLEVHSPVFTGQNASAFNILTPEFPLEIKDGGAPQTVKIQCSPQGTELLTAELKLSTNDPIQPEVSYSLTCQATPKPVAMFDPMSGSDINFGSGTIGTSLGREITVKEDGNTALLVNLVGIKGNQANDFAVSTTFPLVIEDGGEAKKITVQCTPQGEGSRTAQLQFSTNEPKTVSYTLVCEGTALPPPPPYALTVTVQGDGKVTSTPAGIDCGADCTEDYTSGTQVTLTATANANAIFKGWSGACSGTSANTNVTMEAAKTCTATFEPNIVKYPLTITLQGDGKVTSTPAGIDCGADCTEDYTSGTQVTLTATANANAIFKEWSGACTGTIPSVNVTMDVAKTCTATFEPVTPPPALTVMVQGDGKVTSTPAGIECGTDCTDNYIFGTQVTLTATTNANATFKEWSGACTGATETTSVTMDAAKTCTATFKANVVKYPLTVTLQGDGKVTSTPAAGIDCGTNCTEDYASGTQVTLTATANANATFKEWTGDCTGTTPSVSVTMEVVKTCTATFEVVPTSTYPLTIIVVDNGQVASTSVAGIDCGTDCTEDYASGTQVTLTATANADATFKEWSGDCTGTIPSVSVTMDVAKTCTATFKANVVKYPLTVTLQGDGKVTSTPAAGIDCGTDCTEDYASGTQVTLNATANANATFKEWSGDCAGTTSSVSVTMEVAKTCTATFDGEPSDDKPLAVTVQGTGKVTSDSPGIDCDMSGTNCVQNYPVNNQVTLTATSDTGVAFQEWSGACTGTNPSTNITMDKAKICTATFVDGPTIPYPLTIIVEGNGQVASTSVAGIDCGTDCTEAYLYGSSITLTATPNPDHFFDSWSGACAGMEPSIMVDIDSTKECTATFKEIPISYPLAITVDGAGQVDVQGEIMPSTRATTPPCTDSYCNNNYVIGESLTLTANGSSFKGWSGSEDCTGTNRVIGVVMDDPNITCSAIFAEGECPVSNTASTCPNLDMIPIIPSDQAVLTLGTGIDSDRDQPRPFSCLNGMAKMVGGSSVSMRVKAFTSYKDVLDYERKSAGGNLKVAYDAIKVKVGGKVSSINFYDKQSKSRSYLLKYELNMTQQFTPDPAPLNQYGQSYTADACQFKQYCGDQFVWQQSQGVKVYVAMAFSFENAKSYKDFSANAEVGITGAFQASYCDDGCPKQLPVPFSAKFEAGMEKMSMETKKTGNLSITFHQEGGNPQKITELSVGAIGCKLNQMQTCKEAFNKVMGYLGSEEFINDAKASPVIFNSTYSSYSYIPEVPALPSDLTPEIENAREQLIAEYAKRKSALDKAQSLLDNVCYVSRKPDIEKLATSLGNDVNTLEQTIEGCFSDLGNCVVKKCKAFQTLQPYDLQSVEFKPEEFEESLLGCGLVAYYPFDGDMKDQIISGNYGTPSNNPTSVTGILGSAYQFNGDNTHISMPIVSLKTAASDFTISAWFNIEGYNYDAKLNPMGRSAILDLRGDKGNGGEELGCALLIDKADLNDPDNKFAKLTHRCFWGSTNDKTVLNDNLYADIRNNWHHTVLMREGDMLREYLDGEKRVELQGKPLPLPWKDWRVGKRYEYGEGIGNFAFKGVIDQIRIYDRALSDEEITALYKLQK